jgi:hypothetical protein
MNVPSIFEAKCWTMSPCQRDMLGCLSMNVKTVIQCNVRFACFFILMGFSDVLCTVASVGTGALGFHRY